MERFYITGIGGHGKVYLKAGAKFWTQNKAEGHAYKICVQKALIKAHKRFDPLVKDMKLEPAGDKNA